jgi:hypothetical protein
MGLGQDLTRPPLMLAVSVPLVLYSFLFFYSQVFLFHVDQPILL